MTREPFASYGRMLEGARRWTKARDAYAVALEQRRKDIKAARDAGEAATVIAAAYGLSAGRVLEISNERGRQ